MKRAERMRGRIISLSLLIAISGWAEKSFSTSNMVWERKTMGINELKTNRVYVHPTLNQILIGTSQRLYVSQSQLSTASSILELPGELPAINDIYADPQDPRTIYAATNNGLYASENEGKHWQRIFYSSDTLERRCLVILKFNDQLYLGTMKGLFSKKQKEANWHPVEEIFREAVYALKMAKGNMYVMTGQNLYELNLETDDIDLIFAGFHKEGEPHDFLEPTEDSVFEPSLKAISVLAQDHSVIFLVTTDKILWREIQENEWYELNKDLVPLDEMTSLVSFELGHEQCHEEMPSCIGLLAGTRRGAFLYAGGRWMPVYQGLETNGINDLTIGRDGDVYAATDRGIFYLPLGEALPSLFPESVDSGQRLEKKEMWSGGSRLNEPTIKKVHTWAIDYAEVNPDKIKNWRKSARRKAFLPDVSIGLNRIDGEVFHWDTGPNPDVLQKGRDSVGWDASVRWNLGELIWNNDQTSIDSRSKLMVELREDIIDQVTRLYFERRRIQMELRSQPNMENYMRFEKQMRMEELTALLDGFTGGEFSKNIKEQEQLQMQDMKKGDSDG